MADEPQTFEENPQPEAEIKDVEAQPEEQPAEGADSEAPAEDSKAEEETTSSRSAKRWILGRALLGEFLATWLFLFIAMAVPFNLGRSTDVNSGKLTVNYFASEAIAVSFIAVGVIYSFADISGAHFNPAVTFATIVTGKTTWKKGLSYMSAQLLGSIFACFWFIVLFPDAIRRLPELAIVPQPDIGLGFQLMMEFTLTFVLIYVIFSVAFDTVDSRAVEVKQIGLDNELGAKNVAARNLTIYTASGNTKAGFAPIAIGFTLGMLSLVGGSVSGGAYNPARVFGAAMCSGKWDGQWVYWLGDFAGAAAGGWMQILFQRLKRNAGTK